MGASEATAEAGTGGDRSTAVDGGDAQSGEAHAQPAAPRDAHCGHKSSPPAVAHRRDDPRRQAGSARTAGTSPVQKSDASGVWSQHRWRRVRWSNPRHGARPGIPSTQLAALARRHQQRRRRRGPSAAVASANVKTGPDRVERFLFDIAGLRPVVAPTRARFRQDLETSGYRSRRRWRHMNHFVVFFRWEGGPSGPLRC